MAEKGLSTFLYTFCIGTCASLMRRVEALIIFILQVSRPLLSNHAIILDDLRWKNLITITSSDKIHLPKGQKLQPLCHYACARRAATRWIEDAMAEPKPKLGIANKGFKVLWKAFWKEQLTGLLSLFFFLKSNSFFSRFCGTNNKNIWGFCSISELPIENHRIIIHHTFFWLASSPTLIFASLFYALARREF